MGVRIKRNYHNMPPSKFFSFNHRVRRSLAGYAVIPDDLMTSFTNQSNKYEASYQKASFGSRLDIAEREMLQASLVAILDEIASFLEGAAVRKPEILLSCGFDLTKDRRKSSRSKPPLPSPSDEVKADNAG